jgi:putative transposase
LIEAVLTGAIGAAAHERSPSGPSKFPAVVDNHPSRWCCGARLRIPKLHTGSFFPSVERRRRMDQALFAVVMEAYLHGVSTRKVDELVKALGADTGISKSEVSRICAEVDEGWARVSGPAVGRAPFPYVFLDGRERGRRVLDGVPALAQCLRPDRGAAGDLRRPHRPEQAIAGLLLRQLGSVHPSRSPLAGGSC